MEVFFHIITRNIIPIFILIVIGYIIGRNFNLDIGTLSKLNFYSFVPFYSFVVIYTNDLSVNMIRILLFTAAFMAVNYALAFAAGAVRKMPAPKRCSLVNSIIFYNSGNIGIPLITLVFSDSPFLNQALVVQITIMLTQTFTTNTLGFYNAGRSTMHWKDSFAAIFKMPVVYAISAAVILKQFSFDLTSSFAWPAFVYIKQAMIGFVLLTLGVQLSGTRIRTRDPDVLPAVILRLVISPAAALLILKAAGFDGILGQTLFISSAMPTAVTTALIAVERNNEPDFAAKTVMYSTTACSVSLIFVVYLSKIFFPI